MKITSTSAQLPPERIVAGGEARTAAAKPSVAESEKVQLSDLAARLSQLETQFAGSDFDAEKVAAVRRAIAQGRYTVNAEAVADRLLSSVAELLGRK